MAASAQKIAASLRRLLIVPHLAAALGAVAMAIVMTWPLARAMSDHILDAIYGYDAYANAMIMGSRVDAFMGSDALSVYDDYFFAPLQDSIVFNENHFGLSLLFAPAYLLSKNPLLAYNLTLLSSTALSVFLTYLLVRRLTGSGLSGFIFGVAFAFCPYVMFEMGRIQLVATQWIPACFLFLHRAVEERRPRDILGFWLCFVLQIGSCLYYAMFLIPLLSLAGGILLLRERPGRAFFGWFLGFGALAGFIAWLMVHPYFAVRDSFDLERSLAFASGYDGKLGFFGNVHGTNRTLTLLHHPSRMRGAYEEIAFPGFVVLTFGVLGAAVSVTTAVRRASLRALVRLLGILLLAFSLSWLAIWSSSSMLPALGILAVVVWLYRRNVFARGHPRAGLYWSALLLALVLFLGLFPLQGQNEPVRGLYYYLHTYFPGFNGIRKVSRQAVMTSFMSCVVASFGVAWLLARVRTAWRKVAIFALLLGLVGLELRAFPHPLKEAWAGDNVPEMLSFVASLPEAEFVTSIPQYAGTETFQGDGGMAYHNYLALYHKHRFINGQSSYILPVTELVNHAQRALPDDGARRILLSLGARHLLIYGDDLPGSLANIPNRLRAEPQHYQEVFRRGDHSVFSLRASSDPDLELLQTPHLPAAAVRIPPQQLSVWANLNPKHARLAIDGDLRTRWSGGRPQKARQGFFFRLTSPRKVVALEFENLGDVMDVPGSFEIRAAAGSAPFEVVMSRPRMQLHHDQVHAPKKFVFRVVFDPPLVVDRLGILIQQPMPGRYFSIHEARLYELAP